MRAAALPTVSGPVRDSVLHMHLRTMGVTSLLRIPLALPPHFHSSIAAAETRLPDRPGPDVAKGAAALRVITVVTVFSLRRLRAQLERTAVVYTGLRRQQKPPDRGDLSMGCRLKSNLRSCAVS